MFSRDKHGCPGDGGYTVFCVVVLLSFVSFSHKFQVALDQRGDLVPGHFFLSPERTIQDQIEAASLWPREGIGVILALPWNVGGLSTIYF